MHIAFNFLVHCFLDIHHCTLTCKHNLHMQEEEETSNFSGLDLSCGLVCWSGSTSHLKHPLLVQEHPLLGLGAYHWSGSIPRPGLGASPSWSGSTPHSGSTPSWPGSGPPPRCACLLLSVLLCMFQICCNLKTSFFREVLNPPFCFSSFPMTSECL